MGSAWGQQAHRSRSGTTEVRDNVTGYMSLMQAVASNVQCWQCEA